GCVARARQIAGTKSIFFVSLMSRKTSCTNGLGSFSSTSFTVGMAYSSFLVASVGAYAKWHRMGFFAPLERYSVPILYHDFRRMTFSVWPFSAVILFRDSTRRHLH